MGRLLDFVASSGSSLDAVATTIKVRVELLENADRGRQALPLDVARRMALVLGVDPDDVASCVSRLTTSSGELAETPLPPQYGDDFRSVMIARTVPVVIP